jgi:hypothetical protein
MIWACVHYLNGKTMILCHFQEHLLHRTSDFFCKSTSDSDTLAPRPDDTPPRIPPERFFEFPRTPFIPVHSGVFG